MKKWIAVALVVLMCWTMAACQFTDPEPEQQVEEVTQQEEKQETEKRTPAEVVVSIDMETNGEERKPVLSFSTNLPDGTVFDVEVESTTGEYFAQANAEVIGGAATTDAFTQE